ncbi:MAG: SUMF1/EgtB/PvdO family nonheme iron enzyme [Nannocystaceae bacterium]
MLQARLLGVVLLAACVADERAAPVPEVRSTGHVQDCPDDMKRVEGGGELPTFCLDTYEVMAGEYLTCVDAGACTVAFAGSAHGCNQFGGLANHPINCVSAEQAASYCRWRGKRLPEDTEWRWAAHGGPRNTKFPWGDDLGRNQACLLRGAGSGTCPVGGLPDVSPEGIRDLVGNVAEWTVRGGEVGLRGGSWRYRPSLAADDPRSETPSYASGIRCAAALGQVLPRVPAPRGRGRVGEALEHLTLPPLVREAPTRPPENLDVVGSERLAHVRWTELGDGRFIPFAPEDPYAFGLPRPFDSSKLPADHGVCQPIRGLSTSVVLRCGDSRDRSNLVAIDRSGGRVLWDIPFLEEELGYYMHFSPTTLVVYSVQGEREELIGYSLATGHPLWRRESTAAMSAWIDDTGVYEIEDSDQSLWAVNPETGLVSWRRDHVCRQFISDELVIGDLRGIHRVDPRTGADLDTRGQGQDVCNFVWGLHFVVEDLLVEQRGPYLRAYDLESVQKLWERNEVDRFAFVRDAVYAVEGGTLLVLEPTTGLVRASVSVEADVRSVDAFPAGGAYGPLVVVEGLHHHVVTLGRVEAPWQRRRRGSISSTARDGG